MTRHIRTSIVCAALALLFAVSTAYAASESETSVPTDLGFDVTSEHIASYDANFSVLANSGMDVSETIAYDFGSLSRHGIYRFIPYRYKARGGTFTLRISDISVADENKQPYPFTVKRSGGNVQIKVGDANVTITGQHVYVVSYHVERALNYFSSHDELYWNVTGNEWTVPIEMASATVELPTAVPAGGFQLACYTGSEGSTAADCGSNVMSEQAVEFVSDAPLYSGEGLTIVVGWPKGITEKVSWKQQAWWIVSDNWYIVIPIPAFLFSLFYWYRRGRDPKHARPIIAQYEAPDQLTPAEVGALYDNTADKGDISANLVYLAIRGYIKIKQFGAGTKDYEFLKLKEGDDLPEEHERLLLASIFGGLTSKKLKSLENQFYRDMPKISTAVYESITKKGYYDKNPDKARSGLLLTLGILAAIGGIGSGIFLGNWYFAFAMLASAAIFFVFSALMPRRTPKGAAAHAHILGFKEFLQVTEKDRLAFHNPPKMMPELFEKFLPYAMVLGVETSWAKNFEKLYTATPSWYEGYGTSTWNALILANAMHSFSINANNVFVSTPQSKASSGSSGFSGGFSGGGGGGGGGGSW